MVVQMVCQVGKQWPLIASLLPGRTADSVRNRWYYKCRYKSRLAACNDEAGADVDYDQLPRHVAAAPWVEPMGVVSMPMGAGMPMALGVPVGGSAPMRVGVPVATRAPTGVGSPLGTITVAQSPSSPAPRRFSRAIVRSHGTSGGRLRRTGSFSRE